MRITGGRHRSRTLEAPRGDATRPTSDRVREALFGILGAWLPGARVLDLYAGTGALAFEALSRGATSATLVESGRHALLAIQKNVQALGVEARVVPTSVERAVGMVQKGAPYDLVFADPPYAAVTSGEVGKALAPLLALDAPGLLAEDGRLILEHSKGDAPPDLPPLTRLETRRYGDTCLSFYAVSPKMMESEPPRV